MKVKVEKLPKSQLKLNIIVDKKEVKETYNKVLEKAVQETELDGFRKGNAPKDQVEKKLGTDKLYGNVINDLLQKHYMQALKENLISPMSNPKVEIDEFSLEKDFEFNATVAIKPEITFKDYKKDLKKYLEDKNKEVKKQNAEKLKKGEKIEQDHAHLHVNEVIDVVVKSAEFGVADILIEEETNRLVARLVDQILAAGMKMKDYLKAQGTDMEKLKENYEIIAEQNIKAELVLNELITVEKVKVEEAEVDKAIAEVEDEKAREQLNNPVQKVYIRTVLEKQKLIENLIKETQGEHKHEK